MPAPTNSNALTLGRPVIDLSLISDQGTRIVIGKILEMWMGQGCPAGAQAGDTTYQALYGRFVADEWFIYAGKPTDPMNPDLVTSPFSGSTSIAVEDEGSALGSFSTLNFVGAGVTAADAGGGECTITIPGGGGGGSTNAFGTIQVLGQSDVVADAAPDNVEFIAGTGMVITTSAGSDSVTWAINTSEVAQNSFTTIAVSGQSNVVADSPTDTLTLVAGSNVTLTTNAGSDSVTIASTGDGVGYDEIQEEGAPLTKRSKLNFIGADVTATDDAGNGCTNVTLSPGTGRIFRTTSPITAAVWDGMELALGSGDADIFIPTAGDPTIYELSSSGTVYNTVEEEIPADKNVQCKRVNELWIVDVVDCDN